MEPILPVLFDREPANACGGGGGTPKGSEGFGCFIPEDLESPEKILGTDAVYGANVVFRFQGQLYDHR